MRIKFKGDKSNKIKHLILHLLDVLQQVGIPMENLTDRRKERMAEVCLAVAGIKSNFRDALEKQESEFLRTRDIIEFMNENYGEKISSGSYDDVRRKDLAMLVEAGIVINSSAVGAQATNNPTRGYSVSQDFAQLLSVYGTLEWHISLSAFKEKTAEKNVERTSKIDLEKIPVRLPSGAELKLSVGEHNVLQKKIVEDFLTRFGMGAQVLYLGDTSDKFLFRDDLQLESIGFFVLEHDELPDVVAYSRSKGILFLIEAVHSAGPMDESRVSKLRNKLKDCKADIVFVTAFATRKAFRT